MTYDRWKTTNPADEWLGPEPEDDGMDQRGQLTIWIIYDRPDGVVARRFEVGAGRTVATGDTINGKLEDLRQAFWKAGLTKLSRQDGGDATIVESWA